MSPEQLPEERIEPEIERQLTVERIDVPRFQDFKGAITEDELKRFDARFHALVIVDSKTVQALEWLIGKVVMFNRQVRRMEAVDVRQARSRRFVVTHWLEIIIAAAVGALMAKLFNI